MSVECVTLTDDAGQSMAKVLVGFGFNCFQFQVIKGGEPVDVLWSASDFATGKERASGSGTPILFPFPGRIAGVVFRWKGQELHLEEGDGRGNAIHGFVLNRPWRIVDQQADAITGQFQASVDDPQLLSCWPADFRITVSYQLNGPALKSNIVVENPDDKPLPCGLGTHPYFRLPLGGTRAGICEIRLPVSERWELADMLPTGKRLELADAGAYQAGAKFQDLVLDDVFTGLKFTDDWCQAEIHDPEKRRSLKLQFDKVFRECVVYTPPHREAICIEPYTCVPGAFSLDDQAVDAGLRILAPGESFRAHVVMRLD